MAGYLEEQLAIEEERISEKFAQEEAEARGQHVGVKKCGATGWLAGWIAWDIAKLCYKCQLSPSGMIW